MKKRNRRHRHRPHHRVCTTNTPNAKSSSPAEQDPVFDPDNARTIVVELTKAPAVRHFERLMPILCKRLRICDIEFLFSLNGRKQAKLILGKRLDLISRCSLEAAFRSGDMSEALRLLEVANM